MKMSNVNFDTQKRVSKAWIAVRRLDKNDDRIVALQEVSIPPAAEFTKILQIISTAFGLYSSNIIYKLRNHRGSLIPLNSSIAASSKHLPHVLEVSKVFQHVPPKQRTIPSKSMKIRLQNIEKRIQRLEVILPEIKLKRNEKLNQEIECLNQKLRFLHKRMQVADSRSWKGVLTRAPLW
ncbi:uncharacterized protein si:zfos-1056e6.1 [Antennarius striatus]|uniref:uncharacterized protein si:zfos-1056e6.1 n=1 Tax=Antennarius striatus TaxID=241820 RepID=UPI0035B05471